MKLRFRPTVPAVLILSMIPLTVALAGDATIDDVIKMVAAKLPDDAIVQHLRQGKTVIHPTTEQLIQLKQLGASDQLIRALIMQPTGGGADANTPPVSTQASSSGSFIEPELLGIPYFVDDATGKLLELERQNVNAGVKLRAMGFGGGRSIVRFEGSRSTVRFKNGAKIRFVLRVGNLSLADPNSLVNVDRLVAAKDHREATIAKAGFMAMGAKTTAGASEVGMNAVRCGQSSLCLTPATPLQLGEYVITLKDSKYGFLFSVE